MNLNEVPLAKVVTPPQIDYEKEGITFMEDVEYVYHAQKAYRMDIMYPSGTTQALPAVIWVHGGGWSDENLTRKYLPSLEIAALVKRGYVAASIDYRLSQEARFPAQIEDCKSAVRFLRMNAEAFHVDPERIAAWGESAGGHLVELMAFTCDGEFTDANYPGISSRIQAVIPWYAPVDLRQEEGEEKEIFERLFAYEDEMERRQIREKASPIVYAARKNPPTLLMHGDRDRLVAFDSSRSLYEAMKAAGNDVELITVPGQGHGFFDGTDYYHKIYEFLDRTLKNR